MNEKRDKRHRLERIKSPTASSWGEPVGPPSKSLPANVEIDCGWGRLIFAHTFAKPGPLAETLREEGAGRRDIALYVRNPHVVLSLAPQELFLDPSDTYRLWLTDYRPGGKQPKGFVIRRLRTRADAAAINRIYTSRQMVPVPTQFIWKNRSSRIITYLVAEDRESGEIIGTATGIDHTNAFDDPENGASLWCLAVDPQSHRPGVGLALTDYLAGHFLARGRNFMDLSVLHENHQAIGLYEKMGFQRIPAFCLKRKNPINEPLFTGPSAHAELNPYAQIIIDEALRRGIAVDVLDAENGFFALQYGGRTIRCRESLSELTTAIAMSICDDKQLTTTLLAKAGLQTPRQQLAGSAEENRAFLEDCVRVVVKPASGEQGKGVQVNLESPEQVEEAIRACRQFSSKTLLEEFRHGEDLRIIVIDHQVVAGAVRKPPRVIGTGRHAIQALIEKQSRRRSAATRGESSIPIDAETLRCVREAGYQMEDILPADAKLEVRRTANLHTGGTIHDVTDQLHPALVQAAVDASRILNIPVVGLDFIVPDVAEPEYVIIEANERPGLANHEPQPTAERFIDLLFPQTVINKPDRKHHV
jgi:GNAT-family acetyltransferase (TIGR03103 family)